MSGKTVFGHSGTTSPSFSSNEIGIDGQMSCLFPIPNCELYRDTFRKIISIDVNNWKIDM